tara:strand:- start:199 stop:444 length:246 start_codon:yes stop_codon:yes gene_type:complete
MSTKDSKDKKPKNMIPIPPWDPKKKTPWKNIPSWKKDKKPKLTPLSKKKKIITKGDQPTTYITIKKKYITKKKYPKIGEDY